MHRCPPVGTGPPAARPPSTNPSTTGSTTRSPARRGVLAAGAALTALAVGGCGGLLDRVDTGAVPTAPGEPGDTVLRLAHVYDASHPVETCAVPVLQEELLGSGITVESYPSAQLGSEAESLEQLAAGGLDLAIAGPSFLGVWHPPAAVLDGAYLFTDVDDFTRAVEGGAVAAVHEEFRRVSGMRVLSSWYYGTRHLTADVPVDGPEDLAGLKIRTPDAPLYLVNTRAMGGTATPMALDEVYLALQQGTLDAQENPVPTIASNRFAEVQEFLNLTGHIVQGVHLVANDELNSALDPAQRERLDAAAAAAADAVRECVRTEEVETLERWREDGTITVHELDAGAFEERVAAQLPEQVEWGDLWRQLYREAREDGS